jgi:hypothetical protein
VEGIRHGRSCTCSVLGTWAVVKLRVRRVGTSTSDITEKEKFVLCMFDPGSERRVCQMIVERRGLQAVSFHEKSCVLLLASKPVNVEYVIFCWVISMPFPPMLKYEMGYHR